jgi:hypothetical protein
VIRSREGVSMEVENSHEPARRDDEHDRWLAMQLAYSEYRAASEALESTRQSADDTNERLKLPLLEGHQWLAFERYFEARMEFLEARFDEVNPPTTRMAAPPIVDDPDQSALSSWFALINYKSVLQMLAVVLLGTMVFALLHEQRRVRDLEAARDELQATLSQTRDGLRLLGQKLDAWGPAQHSRFQQVEHTVPVPAHRGPVAAPRAAGRRPPGWRRQSGVHAPQKPIAAKRDPAPENGSRAAGQPVFRVRGPARKKRVATCAQCASGSGRV